MDALPDIRPFTPDTQKETVKILTQSPITSEYSQWNYAFVSHLDYSTAFHPNYNILHVLGKPNPNDETQEVATMTQQEDNIHIFDQQHWTLTNGVEIAQTYSVTPKGEIIRSLYTRDGENTVVLADSTKTEQLTVNNEIVAQQLLRLLYYQPYKTYQTQPLMQTLRRRLERTIYKDRQIHIQGVSSKTDRENLQAPVDFLFLQTEPRKGIQVKFTEDSVYIDSYRDGWLKRHRNLFLIHPIDAAIRILKKGSHSTQELREETARLLEAIETMPIDTSLTSFDINLLNSLQGLFFRTLARYTPEGEDTRQASE